MLSRRPPFVLLLAVYSAVTAEDAVVARLPSCLDGATAQPPDRRTLDDALLSLDAALDDGFINVGFLDTRLEPDIESMRRAAALVNSSSARIRFHALLRIPGVAIPGFRVTQLQLPPRAQCLYDGMVRIAHGPGPQYLYKPLLHHVLPTNLRTLILLDTDTVMIRDVRALHAEFSRFGSGAVLGVAPEQTTVYGTHGEGLNGGVQLLHLSRMRSYRQYDAALDAVASGADYAATGRRIGYLGDQTLYVMLAATHPALIHRLPCEWNRQISAHFGFGNASLHSCQGQCGILHANYQPFKCVAKVMQEAEGSCEAWRELRRGLIAPAGDEASVIVRRHDGTLRGGAAAMAMLSSPCPVGVPQAERAELAHAIDRFFADCCVAAAATPGGLAATMTPRAVVAAHEAIVEATARERAPDHLQSSSSRGA